MSTSSPRRAAQYVRMSTEHQRYSITFQSAANAAYAAEHGLEIARTYNDAGISGLQIKNRPGLRALIADVIGGSPGFDVILVFDVSRWGRFQDPDQSAHYEFLCREAGVPVEYTAEPFANDGSLAATLVKHVKRAMAAEYSRELSGKVRRAQSGLAAQGFWMGGPAPYGYRRQAVSPEGDRLQVMEAGQQKALVGYRCVLVEGPPAEGAIVRRIFSDFVVAGLSMQAIAVLLTEEGVPAPRDTRWGAWKIRQILTNEAYVGTLVFGKRASQLSQSRSRSRGEWMRVRDACPAIVKRSLFEIADRNIRYADRDAPDADLLAELKGVLRRHGRLSEGVIQRDPHARSAGAYTRRFGGLLRVYELLGYTPTEKQLRARARIAQHRPQRHRVYVPQLSNEQLIQALAALFREKGRLTAELIDAAPDMPRSPTYLRRFGSLGAAYALVGYIPTEAQSQRFKIETVGPGAV